MNRTRHDKVVDALGGYGERPSRGPKSCGRRSSARRLGKPALINVEIRRIGK
ncbi:MAG: hypothetical protein R3F21_09865 [Myxococcota bacterium]